MSCGTGISSQDRIFLSVMLTETARPVSLCTARFNILTVKKLFIQLTKISSLIWAHFLLIHCSTNNKNNYSTSSPKQMKMALKSFLCLIYGKQIQSLQTFSLKKLFYIPGIILAILFRIFSDYNTFSKHDDLKRTQCSQK